MFVERKNRYITARLGDVELRIEVTPESGSSVGGSVKFCTDSEKGVVANPEIMYYDLWNGNMNLYLPESWADPSSWVRGSPAACGCAVALSVADVLYSAGIVEVADVILRVGYRTAAAGLESHHKTA